jgi:lipid-A-disaccharide synthase
MVRELRARRPHLAIAALGGPALAAAGAQLLHDLTASSVVGLVEVLKNLSYFRALLDETLRWITEHQPRAVCLVDYPGFNLRLAKALFKRGLSAKNGGGIRALYYISPQIWAWKAARRFQMARWLDALAVIFPFETDCYADTTLKTEFVGHPFVAADHAPPVRYDPAGPLLLLPGSRKQAVTRIFPLLLAGYDRLGEKRPPAVVLYPSETVLRALQAFTLPPGVTLQPTGGQVAASAALTSSGTMSMHCALAAIPGAVVYRANPLTWQLGRLLVRVPWLGIANLLLREPMYPEYLQTAAKPEALAAELRDCLGNPARQHQTARHARRLREILRAPATGTAADWLDRELA